MYWNGRNVIDIDRAPLFGVVVKAPRVFVIHMEIVLVGVLAIIDDSSASSDARAI